MRLLITTGFEGSFVHYVARHPLDAPTLTYCTWLVPGTWVDEQAEKTVSGPAS